MNTGQRELVTGHALVMRRHTKPLKIENGKILDSKSAHPTPTSRISKPEPPKTIHASRLIPVTVSKSVPVSNNVSKSIPVSNNVSNSVPVSIPMTAPKSVPVVRSIPMYVSKQLQSSKVSESELINNTVLTKQSRTDVMVAKKRRGCNCGKRGGFLG